MIIGDYLRFGPNHLAAMWLQQMFGVTSNSSHSDASYSQCVSIGQRARAEGEASLKLSKRTYLLAIWLHCSIDGSLAPNRAGVYLVSRLHRRYESVSRVFSLHSCACAADRRETRLSSLPFSASPTYVFVEFHALQPIPCLRTASFPFHVDPWGLEANSSTDEGYYKVNMKLRLRSAYETVS